MKTQYIGRMLSVLVFLSMAIPVISADTKPDSINLTQAMKPGDVYKYNAKVQLAGKAIVPGIPSPMPIDAVFEMQLTHTVVNTNKEGLIQLTVVAENASAVISGQKIPSMAGAFPNLTILIDKNGEIKQVFAENTDVSSVPGLKYRNLILLFMTYAPVGELKSGTSWNKSVLLPPAPEKYNLSYNLQSIEALNGVNTAKVKTDITIVPDGDSGTKISGYALTNFAKEGKLLKSHAEVTVKYAAKKGETAEATPSGSNSSEATSTTVTVDISRVDSKPTEPESKDTKS
jgi:hypothetical protein